MSVYTLSAVEICRDLVVAKLLIESLNVARALTRRPQRKQADIESDFAEGAEGTGHVHPHEVFHADCRRVYFPVHDHA